MRGIVVSGGRTCGPAAGAVAGADRSDDARGGGGAGGGGADGAALAGVVRAGGLAAVEGRHAGSQGAPSFLTAEQQAELADEVATGRFRTAAEIRRWVAGAVGRALHRGRDVRAAGAGCGAPRRCPAPSTRRPTTSRRRGGKRGARTALDAVGLTPPVGSASATSCASGLRGTTRRVWGRRGVKVRQRLQLTYEWRYLFAAVDGQAGRVWWNWVPR